MKINKMRGFISIFLVLIMVIGTIIVNNKVGASTYQAKNLTIKAQIGKKVVIKPVVYKNGVKLNLKKKGYSVLWAEECKQYGGLVNGGTTKTIKKLRAEDCYNSSYKKKYSYIVQYNTKEVARGTVYILHKGKVKVDKIKVKTLKQKKKDNGNILILKYKKNITATDIEVMFATDNKFKDKKIKKYVNTTSLTIEGVEAGKAYYVKARGWAVINKKKTYGKWSKVVKIEVPEV